MIAKAELIKGKVIKLDNSEFQESIQSDDVRCAEVFFADPPRNNWATGFNILFNGEIIHTCKTFPSLEKRLEKLTRKWNLKIVED